MPKPSYVFRRASDEAPDVPYVPAPRCQCGSELRPDLSCHCGAIYEKHANGRIVTRLRRRGVRKVR